MQRKGITQDTFQTKSFWSLLNSAKKASVRGKGCVRIRALAHF